MPLSERMPVYFPVGNQEIKATLFPPENMKPQNPGVLFIHGWGTDETHYVERAAAVAEKGGICLTFDLRGHGGSGGEFASFSRADHLQDALAAYDFLVAQKGVDKHRIGLCGVSYGGYLASILSSKRNVRWLALRSPALYKNDNFTAPTARLIANDANVFSQRGIKTQDNIALHALSKFPGSVLLVESEEDTVVPRATIENYLEILKQKLLTYKVIKRADHPLSNEEWKLEFITILSDWFAMQFK